MYNYLCEIVAIFMLTTLKKDLFNLRDSDKAKILKRFFKTGKGQYGEGDRFLGVTVPRQRQIAKKYRNTHLSHLETLLSSSFHEYRLTALIILCLQFKEAGALERKLIFDFYLRNLKNINNWDLVDISAPNILGEYLFNKDKSVLYKLALSKEVWQRRISILSTFFFIKNGSFSDTLNISGILINDAHDLIHKAVGWMLREIGKRDMKTEEEFLEQYISIMPRTMLRYAIEKLSQEKRERYLKFCSKIRR